MKAQHYCPAAAAPVDKDGRQLRYGETLSS
jgi:hypothetical protein